MADQQSKTTRDRAGELWTDSEDQMLIQRFRSGLSCEEIADVHGRTEVAILTRLDRFGLVIYMGRSGWHKISETAWVSRI